MIIAGSHSGFSTAWMLLNGPATYNRNNSRNIDASKWPKMGDAVFKTNPNCTECCTCPDSKKKKEQPKCACICKCFGYFNYKDWDFDYETVPKHFEEGSIKILYRDKIRVFYGTVK